MSARTFATFGAASGFVAVAAGAFGSHLLKKTLSAEMLDVFDIAVRYQMFHALALFAAAWVCERWPGRAARAAGWCFVIGTVIFCATLYALALTGVKVLGALTPVGGACFMLGWLLLTQATWSGMRRG
jgi:uncharacterized membrane protein YgdD (TMEM256/DUF423 family)